MKILNLRGTNGSGKSYLVHQLMKEYKVDIEMSMIFEGDDLWEDHPVGHHIEDFNLYLCGRYDRTCGGCDSVPTQDDICEFVRNHWSHGNVLFEGYIVSHIFGRYSKLAHDAKDQGHDFTFAFLDTSLETCIDRVKKRREAAGNKRKYDPKNTIRDYHSINNLRNKMREEGHNVVVIDIDRPYEHFKELL